MSTLQTVAESTSTGRAKAATQPRARPTGRGRLADGRRWQIRRLRPDDGPRLAACFARMSDEARLARFFTAKRRLTDAEIAHFSRPDGWEHMAMAAFAADGAGREQELLGAVRCLRLPHRRDTADFAIAVADDARGVGLGCALLSALMAHARPRGIHRLHCDVLWHNQPMRALAERFGGEPVGSDADSLAYTIPVARRPAGDASAFAWPGLVLPDPVAMHHDWCSLLDDAASPWLPGACASVTASAAAAA
ncbi:N-acetyltransferase family protein [Thiohalocapsa halophila]